MVKNRMEGFSCLKWVFIIKLGSGRGFSSHDEGPASTARFTGGQVNGNIVRHGLDSEN